MTLTPPHEYSYFFSVFGVALTHLVLEDDDYHHKGITPSRDSDDVLNAKALAAEGAAGRNSPPPPGNARQRAEAQKYPNTLESLEVLRAVNERVAAASSVPAPSFHERAARRPARIPSLGGLRRRHRRRRRRDRHCQLAGRGRTRCCW